VPTDSSRPHVIRRCGACRTALWSTYGGRESVRFVRVGTLDDPKPFPPDIHVFTSTKLPWVQIPPGQKAFAEFYDARKEWPPEAQARWKATRPR
jgi:hypothetical protein